MSSRHFLRKRNLVSAIARAEGHSVYWRGSDGAPPLLEIFVAKRSA
ncbi:MAG: hypothetical protein WBQ86_18080 [Candidatus Binatus sp.]